MLLLFLMATFAVVASDVSHLQEQEEYNSEPPAKPYAFTYTAYPGHADRQHTEVSDDSGVIRGQYSYIDPSQRIQTVKYVADKQGFHPIRNDAPLDQPKITEAVDQAKNLHYYLYNRIAEDHQQYPYLDVEPGALVDKGAYVYPGALVMSGAVIKHGAIIYDGATVKRGAVVGPYSRVANNAVVWDGVVLGEGVTMYQGAQVKDFNRALVKRGAVLNYKAVVGKYAEVGVGAVMGQVELGCEMDPSFGTER